MLTEDLRFQIALTLVPGVGDKTAKQLLNRFESARGVFNAPLKELLAMDGIGKTTATAIRSFDGFKQADQELAFIEKNSIQALSILHPHYPQRLLNCIDSPSIIYSKGNLDFNATKIISIVGTRSNTDYGKHICEKIIEGLKGLNVVIVSGLAFGIDTIAHKAALQNNLSTIGVLAHGLHTIYPTQNKQLAQDMLEFGGIVTDFMSGTKPDKMNFPQRNRIVAGICDALIVIESNAKGGSLITADLAVGYNKDVFAVPGRATDSKSEGCNNLIKNNSAGLITNAEDLIAAMGWQKHAKPKSAQRQLFIDLSPEEKTITDILAQNPDGINIDALTLKANLPSSAIAQALLMLEMQNVIYNLPGKIYKLL